MSPDDQCEIVTTGGAEETIAAMDDARYTNIGQSTYYFVRRLMRNPEYKAMIRAKAAELQTSGSI